MTHVSVNEKINVLKRLDNKTNSYGLLYHHVPHLFITTFGLTF